MRKTVKYIIIVVITALLFNACFIPYAKTKGVVVDSFQTAGTVVDNMDGSYYKLEIDKSITVEVEVYYNPIYPFINRLGT